MLKSVGKLVRFKSLAYTNSRLRPGLYVWACDLNCRIHLIMYQSRKQSNFRLREASSRSTKSNCEICQNKFQMLVNQQHQCKRCWRAICINCSPNRIKVFQTDGTSAIHKICKICQKDEEMINALIKENKLIFQLSSKLSEEWMKKINKERLNFQDIIN